MARICNAADRLNPQMRAARGFVRRIPILQALLCCAGVLLLTSCASTNRGDASVGVDPRTAEVIKSSKIPYSQGLAETVDRVKTGATEDDDRVKIFKGSGIMVKGQTPWQPMPAQGAAPATPTTPPATPPARTTTAPAATTPPPAATPATPPVQVTPATPATPPTPAHPPVTPAIKGGAATPPAATPPAATPPAATPPTTAPAAKGTTTPPSPPATPAATTKGATAPAAKGTTAKGTAPAAKGKTPAKGSTPPAAATKSAATPPAKGIGPTTPPAATTPPATPATPTTPPPAATPPTTPTPPAATTPPPAATPPVVTPRPPTQPTPPSNLPSARGGGNIVLNFEAADLREVIRNILGDILGEAYLIDPTVNGQVTIRTTSGIPRESLYATLETLLRMNNATMIQEGGVYKILPAALGFKGSATPQLGSSQRPLPKGFSVQIVPLRYVSAKDMLKILDPFAKDSQASMRADEMRNLVVLSGTELELRHLLDTVEMFDINWMAGMSVGMFKLRNVDVKGLAQDLQNAQAGDNGMGLMLGSMKLIPIERMNMLLVVTPQPDQLDEMKKWIEKFDADDNTETPRLYVYSLRYARAEKLAPLLQQAFTGKNTAPTRTQAATTAPGTTSVTMGGNRLGGSTGATGGMPRATGLYGSTYGGGASPYGGSSYTSSGGFGTMGSTANRPGTTGTTANRPGTTAARPGGVPAVGIAGSGMGIAQDVQVVADEDNNAILIVATPAEYALAEQAIKKLDIPQRQVVIEVTMAEVTLSSQGSIGTQWWFTGSSKASNAHVQYGSGTPAASAIANGFSLIISKAKFDAFFSATDLYNNMKMVANPHIAALDNQEAHIEITTSYPYASTNYYDSGISSGNNYSQTWGSVSPGVTLTIKPHINEGGNVSMEADISFSAIVGTPPDPADTTASTPPPQMSNRSITSQLMVPSGSTMVIGGLIRDDKSNTDHGIPLLSRIPVMGALFGSQGWNNTRTELVIFLTPRVVDSEETRRSIIQDLRYRMDNLEGFLLDSKALPTDLIRREREEEEKAKESKSGSI